MSMPLSLEEVALPRILKLGPDMFRVLCSKLGEAPSITVLFAAFCAEELHPEWANKIVCRESVSKDRHINIFL
jgi:hypothetical protein